MANQKSKYTETLYTRVTVESKQWACKQVPRRFASFSAYVDFLLRQDRLKINHREKSERPEGL